MFMFYIELHVIEGCLLFQEKRTVIKQKLFLLLDDGKYYIVQVLGMKVIKCLVLGRIYFLKQLSSGHRSILILYFNLHKINVALFLD